MHAAHHLPPTRGQEEEAQKEKVGFVFGNFCGNKDKRRRMQLWKVIFLVSSKSAKTKEVGHRDRKRLSRPSIVFENSFVDIISMKIKSIQTKDNATFFF